MQQHSDEIHPDNIIPHGSDEAFAYLGLVKPDKSTPKDLILEDPDGQPWTLAEGRTLYGVVGWETETLRGHLQQRINDAFHKPPTPQSEDPTKEGYAPPLWLPRPETESPVKGIV